MMSSGSKKEARQAVSIDDSSSSAGSGCFKSSVAVSPGVSSLSCNEASATSKLPFAGLPYSEGNSVSSVSLGNP